MRSQREDTFWGTTPTSAKGFLLLFVHHVCGLPVQTPLAMTLRPLRYFISEAGQAGTWGAVKVINTIWKMNGDGPSGWF